jgi:hypothetical protein
MHSPTIHPHTSQLNTPGPVWQVMQALSHYSYHKSGGQMVLCDLQGGMLSRGRGAVLTGGCV